MLLKRLILNCWFSINLSDLKLPNGSVVAFKHEIPLGAGRVVLNQRSLDVDCPSRT